jgi:hypothetical protein
VARKGLLKAVFVDVGLVGPRLLGGLRLAAAIMPPMSPKIPCAADWALTSCADNRPAAMHVTIGAMSLDLQIIT